MSVIFYLISFILYLTLLIIFIKGDTNYVFRTQDGTLQR